MKVTGWRLFRAGWAGQRRPILRLLFWSIVEALPALLSGAVVARALDSGFLAGDPARGMAWLGVLAGGVLASAVATRALFPWLGILVEAVRDHLVRTLAGATLRTGVVSQSRPDTAAVARLTEQIEAVRRLTAALLRTLRQLSVTVVASIVGLAALAPVLGLVVGPPLVVALLVFAWLLRRLRDRQLRLVLAEERVAREAGGVFAGMRDVVACRAQDRATHDVDSAIDTQVDAARSLARAACGRTLVVALGSQLPLLAALAVGPWLVRSGRLSTGELTGAATYLTVNLQPALRSLVQTLGSWGMQLDVVLGRLATIVSAAPAAPGAVPARSRRRHVARHRASELGAAHGRERTRRRVPGRTSRRAREDAEELTDASGPPTLRLPLPSPLAGELLPGSRYDLRTVGLTFAYGPHAVPVVDRLDLTIEEGEHVALVGPSGTGKSTLATLLCGLARGQRGVVRLGGTALQHLDPAALRRDVALIPQEAYVFAGTLRANLTYLQPAATESDLDAAVTVIGLQRLVGRIGGYSALVRPRELSGGERQLVALARVYLSSARVVLLDEATSLLDPAAEATAESAFSARPGTVVVVAHRISSAARAGRVVLLDHGQVTTGSHHELAARSPLYASLLGHWQPPGTPDVPAPLELVGPLGPVGRTASVRDEVVAGVALPEDTVRHERLSGDPASGDPAR